MPARHRSSYAAPVNLQQLGYVVATADRGTMTAAAAACSVGQPALSRAIRALERELGLAMFERRGRTVELTEGGRVVVAAARRALAEVEAIVAYGRRTAGTAVLTVAATPTIQADLGSGLIGDFWRRYPQFPVRFLHCESAHGVGQAVASGRADAGITDVPSSAGLVEVPYEWREVVVVAPPGSGLPDPLPMAALGDLALILPTAGTVRRAQLERMFEGLAVRPQVAFESDERGSWLPAVVAGLGCCIWYRSQAQEAVQLGARALALDPAMGREVAVVHRHEALGAPVAGLVRLAERRAQRRASGGS